MMNRKSGLTELEMGVVFELIQLRGSYTGDFTVQCVDFPMEKCELRGKKSEESLSLIELEINTAGEILPRRNKRYRSLADIYRKTQPYIKNGAKKIGQVWN
ncbi:Unknown protein [Striga hermonthica]|uniref:Uncharacterized protein n=1 Tax=Striga hermonthica TaxID=68872 RepID=A0A9N7RLK3_STRHE|nr:Unknown protein [Striga hermonthica]